MHPLYDYICMQSKPMRDICSPDVSFDLLSTDAALPFFDKLFSQFLFSLIWRVLKTHFLLLSEIYKHGEKIPRALRLHNLS